jgi:hypothetical protein
LLSHDRVTDRVTMNESFFRKLHRFHLSVSLLRHTFNPLYPGPLRAMCPKCGTVIPPSPTKNEAEVHQVTEKCPTLGHCMIAEHGAAFVLRQLRSAQFS